MFFFCPKIPSRIHNITFSCHVSLGLLLVMTVSQAFLFVFDDLKVLGLLVRYFKEWSSTAIYLVFVLMIRLGNSTEVKCYFHHISSKVHIINMAYHYCVNFMTWLRKCLSGFPTVKLWELDHKEGRTPKKWCLRTVVLKKTPESPLNSKEIKPVILKGNQPWVLVGRTDTKGEAPVFWSSDTNSPLIGKVPDAGKDWGQETRESEDEMAKYHHWFNGYEVGQTLRDGDWQGGLACCSPWGCKEFNPTERLNNCKVTLLFPFHKLIFERKPLSQITLKQWRVMLHLLDNTVPTSII